MTIVLDGDPLEYTELQADLTGYSRLKLRKELENIIRDTSSRIYTWRDSTSLSDRRYTRSEATRLIEAINFLEALDG